MKLIIDADAMIKLYRSGVLKGVISEFSCKVPRAVYDEVVTQGKYRLYQDAEAIESIVSGNIEIVETPRPQRPETGLGCGELGILEVLQQEMDLIVVSDDRRFLNELTRLGAGFLTPADILVLLAARKMITKLEARKALERLRPLIRAAAYHEALEYLKQGDEQ